MNLQEFFAEHQKVAIAFSGGVDSAYLLYMALQCGADVQAYYVKSQFQPQFEMDDAIRLASQLKADMKVISINVLTAADVIENTENRCYHCKKMLFGEISKAAIADGYEVLLDGTNASDEEGDRPGMRALKELSVYSPLRICGLTKDMIRRLSKEAGLFTWDKPAYACLATRIRTGEVLTAEKLLSTEKAENYLFSLGFHDFRVRMFGSVAKLQLPENQLGKLLEYRNEILKELKNYYTSVLLDLEVRNEQ